METRKVLSAVLLSFLASVPSLSEEGHRADPAPAVLKGPVTARSFTGEERFLAMDGCLSLHVGTCAACQEAMKQAKDDPGNVKESGTGCSMRDKVRTVVGILGLEIAKGDVGLVAWWCSSCLGAHLTGKAQCEACEAMEKLFMAKAGGVLQAPDREADQKKGGDGLFGAGTDARKGQPKLDRKGSRKKKKGE